MHSVAILVLDGVVPFDMAAPMQVFDFTRLPDGRHPYRVRLCAERPEVAADGGFTLRVDRGRLQHVVPWSSAPDRPTADDLRAFAARFGAVAEAFDTAASRRLPMD